MTLYDQEDMRPDNSMILLSFHIYKLEEEFEQYISPYASECKFFPSDKGYTYHMLGTRGDDYLLIKKGFVKGSWDSDYADWSGSCTVEMKYRKEDLKYLQKGAYVELYVNRFPKGTDIKALAKSDKEDEADAIAQMEKDIEEYDRKWKDRDDAPKVTYMFFPVYFPYIPASFTGFITDIKFNTTTVEVTCSSYGVVLEEKATLSFQDSWRSDILYEVIQTAGLIPNIDITNLYDEVISWSSNKDGDNTGQARTGDDCTSTQDMACLSGCSSANSYGSNHNFDDCYTTGYAVEGTEYYNWAKQYNSGEEMLRALRGIWSYDSYWSNRTCPQQLFNSSGFSSNCYDACRMVKVLCDSIGFPCVVVTGSAYRGGHGWNVIKTSGQWLSFDLCYRVHAGESISTNMSNIL